MSTYAGRAVLPALISDNRGNALPGINVTVYNRGTVVKPTLYTDRTKATTLANPFLTDAYGNVFPYVEPGEYDMLVNGVTIPFSVVNDPAEPVDAEIADASITNAKVAADAAIAQSKIAGLVAELAAKATSAEVTAAVNALIDSSPAALNTLNELAAALGDDANFATTVTTSLADKAKKAPPVRRPGLLVPAGTRVRGVNLVPPSGSGNPDHWGKTWGQDWDWDHVRDLIDLAKEAGANCVRFVGGANVTRGGSTQSAYIARQQQVAQYLLDLGMLYYPCGAGDLVPSTEVAELITVITAQAVAMAEFPNVIGMDLFQEYNGWASSFGGVQATLISTAIAPIHASVKAAVPHLPVTFSRVWDMASAVPYPGYDIQYYVDFHDAHIYSSVDASLIEGMNELASWGLPILVGEAGLLATGTEPVRIAHRARLRMALERPDLTGVCWWAIADWDTGNEWGLYDGNLDPRTDAIDFFKTLPTTDGPQRLFIPAADDLTLDGATGAFEPWEGTLNDLADPFLTITPAVPLRARITQTIDVESAAAAQLYAGRVLLDGEPASDYQPGDGGTVHDAGPNHYDGTVVGAPVIVSPLLLTPTFGGALELTTSDYVDFGTEVGVDDTGDWTVECTIRRGRSGGALSETFVSKWGAASWNFLMLIENNKFRAYSKAVAAYPSIVSTTTIAEGQVYRLAFSYNGGIIRLFVDGVLEDSTNAVSHAPNPTDIRLLVGRRDDNTEPFEGAIDELRISSVCRYFNTYTPATAPFEPDADTVLLAHFNSITSRATQARAGGATGRQTAQVSQDVYLAPAVEHTIVPQIARVSGADTAGVLHKDGTGLLVEWQPA